MNFTHHTHDGAVVIAPRGEITADSVEPLKRLVNERLESGAVDFVFDLEKVEFIDSRGLEALLWVRERAAERLGQLRLAAPSEPIRQILHITRLDQQLEACPDLEQALGAVMPAPPASEPA